MVLVKIGAHSMCYVHRTLGVRVLHSIYFRRDGDLQNAPEMKATNMHIKFRIEKNERVLIDVDVRT